MRRHVTAMFMVLAMFVAAGTALAQTQGADGGQAVQATEQVVVHFVVVPRVLPGGKEPAGKFPELRKFLAKTAGGYTQLGSCDGGVLAAGGEVRSESNICFLVSAPRDLSAEITAYVKGHFENKTPFILTWPGNRH